MLAELIPVADLPLSLRLAIAPDHILRAWTHYGPRGSLTYGGFHVFVCDPGSAAGILERHIKPSRSLTIGLMVGSANGIIGTESAALVPIG
jgi:hypothetical protein